MKFVINRDVFSDAVSFAVKLLPQRPTMPILSGVRIEATADGVVFSSFDFESSARTTVQAAVDAEGVVLVSGKMMSDIAAKLPQREVRIEDDGQKVSIRCGNSNFSLAKMPLEEYPTVPTVELELTASPVIVTPVGLTTVRSKKTAALAPSPLFELNGRLSGD